MKLLRSRMLWGLLLVIVGILFLLESLQIIALGQAWAAIFAVAGLVFAYTYLENRENWWAVIPAMTLIGIAGTTLVSDPWGAGIFLGCLSLAFWIIYVTTRGEQWWGIIPGGVLLSLALAVALEEFVSEDVFVAIFFLGMGLTFALVYILPTPDGRKAWALIPAAILGSMGLIFFTAATDLAGLVWPTVLILVGAYILFRSLRR